MYTCSLSSTECVAVCIERKKERVKLSFPTPLAEKLGVNQKYFNKPIDNEKHAFTHSVNLNTKIHQIYVYSDIAS